MPTAPPLTLVILAAGRSARFGRLKQLTSIGPGGATLLDYALYDGLRAGFSRFVLIIQEAMRHNFEDHLRPAIAAGLDVRFTHQQLTHPAIPAAPPPGRTRPWGTGFAVLTAAEALDGPFAVCNADDFYGRRAYTSLAKAMTDALVTTDASADLPAISFTVGYPLAVTLSDSGGVSRGVCHIGEAGDLKRLTEGLELRRDGDRARGRDVARRPIDVPVTVPVCMNLWGFPAHIIPHLRDLFAAFMATGPGLDGEFYLTEAINDLVAAGRVNCFVLPTRERWLGITFPGDHAGVAESLRALVDSKVYPRSLWDSPTSLPRHQDGR